MNKLIQKLADQCTDQYRDGHGNYVDHVDLEKFAELIVRECMRMCEVSEMGLLTHGLKEQSYGASSAKHYISDWFGVEL